MPESILFDFAGHILTKLTDGALQELGLWWGVNDEIEKLKDTVSSIQAVLVDAEEQQASNHGVKEWLEKLKEVVFEADDVLDDFATEALRRQVMDGNRITKEVRIFFSRSNQFSYGLKMGRKIKDLRERLDAIDVDRNKFKLETQRGALSNSNRLRDQTTSAIPEVVIGRDEDREKLISLVLGCKDDEKVSVISIVGIGGLGKTTLAQLVFNDERVKSQFDLKIWVCVSDPFDVMMIVRKILRAANSKADDPDLEILKGHLDKCLENKRFLIVLDDVWNEEGEIWESLKRLLVSGAASGSKIIVTTRSIKVAEITRTLSPHVLQGLSPDESWSLLVQVALKGMEPQNKRVIKIGKEIVERCSGVPLAIKTIGRVLFFKNPETEWLPFMENELFKVPQSPTDILPTLKLSYDYLPSHLKRCFAYCRLFPKDYEIDVKTLIHLWVSQGFVESNLDQCLEAKGLDYVKELTWRSFFQELKWGRLGNVESCKMHDLMNDLANRVDEKTHHVSFEFPFDSSGQVPAFLVKANGLRTFLLSSQEPWLLDRWQESESTKATFSKFMRLRVLDLHELRIENLFPFIKKKKHLRYLDVSRNYRIQSLPNSVTRLPNLQVLKLSNCSSLKELPKKIRKLIHLRHLDIEGCSSLTHMPKGIGELTSLQTLSWFIVAKDSCVSKNIASLKELGRLNELRGGIQIRNLIYVKSGEIEPEAKILEEKKHLQSLDLHWCGNSRDPLHDESLMQSLQPHSNLKEFSVNGYGGVMFPGWLSSLENLVHLCIENCKKCGSLPPLDQIPCLKELKIKKLVDLEFIDSEENLNGGESMYFPSLKELLILHCPKLKGWRKGRNDNCANTTTESGLSLLEVDNCASLMWVPLIPFVTGKLCFYNTNLESLQQTMVMKMNVSVISLKDWEGCKILPPLDQIHSLKELLLSNLKDLEYIDSEENNGGGESMYFPSLKKLQISDCPKLKGWKKGRNDAAATNTISDSNLSLLQVKNCASLMWVPLIPFVTGKLLFKNANLESLQQTMVMKNVSVIWLEDWKGCRFLPPLDQIHSLKELLLSNLKDLEYIDSEADGCFSTGQRESKFYPSLKKLELYNCPEFKGWRKKKRDDDDDTPDAVTAADLPQFPNLSKLEINHCPKLSCMPLFPSLEEKLHYGECGIEPLLQTIKIETKSVGHEGPQLFTNLKELHLYGLEDLEYIDSEENCGQRGAIVCPSLKTLSIVHCPKLTGWWKMRANGRTTTTVTEFPHFPVLYVMEIKHCPNLALMPLFPSLDTLLLEHANTEPLKQTLKMTAWGSSSLVQPLSRLEVLRILKIEDLGSLPAQGLQNLTSLRQLYINGCSRLASLPQEMHHLTSLQELDISGCPLLTQRCRKNEGVDWPQIAHIPSINIDYCEIQLEAAERTTNETI